MDASKCEQFYKTRIEELEKQLESRNFKIDSLCKEIKLRSDDITRLTEKHQIACEARDENKFKVVQLEKDVSVLKKKNEDLISQLNEQKMVKNSRELSLEAVVASYVDQIKKYEERIEAYETKISLCETSLGVSSSEKSFEKRNNISNNEDCIKILQLESDLKLLSLENEDLKSKLGKERERKDSRLQSLETHVKSCTDKLLKYEQTIKDCETKIIHLETEKKEMVCMSEAHVCEMKKLQDQLETCQNTERKSEEEKITIARLQEELSNFKSFSKNQMQAETDIKVMPAIGSITKGVSDLKECRSILTAFVEQHRNLQMKFEEEMKNKLQQIEETISKEHDILIVKSPVSLKNAELPMGGKPEECLEISDKGEISTKSQKKKQQKSANNEAKDLQSHKMVKPKAASQKEKEKDHSQDSPIKFQNKKLQKTAKSEVKVQDSEFQNAGEPDVARDVSQKELVENVEKDGSVRTPLKPQNRRQQKTTKTEVKDSEKLKTVKPSAGNAVSQKKNAKKNKKIQDDENLYSPSGPKDCISENIKTAVAGISPISNEGRRQLRTRRKV